MPLPTDDEVARERYEEAAAQAVSRGVALLDEHGPRDWADRVSLAQLNMRDGKFCVLGQTFGTYGRGINTLLDRAEVPAYNGELPSGALYGFDVPPVIYDEDDRSHMPPEEAELSDLVNEAGVGYCEYFDYLQRTWKAVIADRQVGDPS